MTTEENNEIELRIDDERWNRINNLEETVRRSFNEGLKCTDNSPADIGATIVLSDNLTVKQLNQQWREKDKPTNILSFPAPVGEKTDQDRRYLGDMILAYGIVKSEAEEQGKALETHLCHLVIHGALHLLGFDHVKDDEALEMEDLERTAMTALELPDPYLPVGEPWEKIKH